MRARPKQNYNCTKPGHRCITHYFDQNLCASSAHVTFLNCTFRFYNCANCDQLHTKIYLDNYYGRSLYERSSYIYDCVAKREVSFKITATIFRFVELRLMMPVPRHPSSFYRCVVIVTKCHHIHVDDDCIRVPNQNNY